MHSRKLERWKKLILLVNRWDMPLQKLGKGAKTLLALFQRKTLQTLRSFCAVWSAWEKWCWNWKSSWLPDQLIGKELMVIQQGLFDGAGLLVKSMDHQIAWFSWSCPYHQIFWLHKHISWLVLKSNKAFISSYYICILLFLFKWSKGSTNFAIDEITTDAFASTHAEFRTWTWWHKERPRDV